MRSEALGIDVERLALPHGYAAVLVSGPDDRPPYESPPGERPRVRRDPRTSHVWATCACPSCAERRAASFASRQPILPGLPKP